MQMSLRDNAFPNKAKRREVFLNSCLTKGVKRRFYTSFILMAFTLSSMLSCSSTPPKQTYLKKNHLSKLKVVALSVSASEIDVKYSREEEMSPGARAVGVAGCLLISPLLIIGAMAGDALVKSSEDSNHTEGVKKNIR